MALQFRRAPSINNWSHSPCKNIAAGTLRRSVNPNSNMTEQLTEVVYKPKLLVSNDDGIHAPGIRALVAELVKANCWDIYVCAPSSERSAQSHAITLGRYLACEPTELPGAVEAYAVDGTPADSVMLALHSPLLGAGKIEFDLVLSGINRGDNNGLHVIYSGTVGAAREAACKGVPSIALSLDSHLARKQEDYQLSADMSVSLIKAALGLLPGQSLTNPPCKRIVNALLNVNFPNGVNQLGFHLCHQSQACVFPSFKEVHEDTGPHMPFIDEHTPNSRVFRNFAGYAQSDDSEGGDAWACSRGWASVTPLGLRQDLLAIQPSLANGDSASHNISVEDVIKATSEIIEAAATHAGMAAGGIGSKL